MTDTPKFIKDMSPEAKRALLAKLLRDKVRSAKSYPLSFAQERLWFLNQFQPGLPVYNIPMPLRWPGPLNIAALEQSLNEMVRRHETLRTTFQVVDGRPVQVITPARPLPLPLVDLRSVPLNTREAEAQRLMAKEAEQVFDMVKGPLFRFTLVQLHDMDHLLLLNMHHIISDGWSIGILMRELPALYEAFSGGRTSPLAELPMQYADFAQWQREYLTGEVLESHLSYWRQQLAGAPAVLELPADRLRPAVQSYHGAWQPFRIRRSVQARLKQLSQREGVTLFMTLLAAFKTLLYRYTNQEDLVVGTPIANRNRAEIEGLIGFFVNTLVLRTHLAGNPRFQDVLGQVREVTLGAYAHQDLPFEKLVEELQPERNLSYNPLFQVMFAFQNVPTMAPAAAEPRESVEAPDATSTPPPVGLGTAKFDLTLSMAESAEGLAGTFEYNTDLFEHATITRMIGHFQTLLDGIAAKPEQHVSDLPLLTEAERRQVLVEWNATKVPYPENACIHELFEMQVESTPAAEAVVCGDQRVSYRELNRRANQLAHYLRKFGVGPEVRVGICVERSVDMVMGVLGILKAGGAYVPLDPAYPRQRLAFMLEDAQVRVLVTQQKLLESLPRHEVRVIDLDVDRDAITRESDSNPATKVTPDNLLAVFYTSGSTGKPKGILEHIRGFVSLVDWYRTKCAITAKSRALSTTSFTFDAWFKPAMAPLLAGGVLIIPGMDLYDVEKMLETIEAQRVSTFFSTPSLLYPLIELAKSNNYKSLATVETVSFGGEPIDVGKLRPWVTSPHCQSRLIHIYGPSECSDAATTYEPAPTEISVSSHFPIGRAINNVTVYVLNEHLGAQPIGVPGELCISGLSPSRGYLNRAALTAEKFVPNPFARGERLYKTGDLVKWLPTGNVEFLGRFDHQVKIRGIRIELGEIESVLGQHPGVKENVVFVTDNPTSEKRLVGYIVPKENHAVAISDLRHHLKAKLPEYMVPALFLIVDALPISPNGKIDRKALASLSTGALLQPESFSAPRTPMEEVIAGIWKEVLAVERMSIHDNFFELGGHSLMATQVISRIRDSFQLELPVRRLFEAPTVAELAGSMLQDPTGRERIEKTAEVLMKVVRLSDSEVERALGGN